METLKKYILNPWIIVFVMSVLLFTCKRTEVKKETVTIKIPQKIVQIDTAIKVVYKKSKPEVIKIAGKEIEVENPVNIELAENFNKQTDSIKRLKLYLKAIAEKEQIRTFVKDGVKVDVKTKTRGDILNQSISLTIKEQKIEVPKKEDNFGFLLSSGLMQNQATKNINFEAGAGIRIKKVGILLKGNTNREIGISLIKEF
jgi:hypothetical protein